MVSAIQLQCCSILFFCFIEGQRCAAVRNGLQQLRCRQMRSGGSAQLPAAVAPQSNAQVLSLPMMVPIHPAQPSEFPPECPHTSALPVHAARATPREPAPARLPLQHASKPRPILLAPPSLIPHAGSLQLCPWVPNHPRPCPSPHAHTPRPVPRAPFTRPALACLRPSVLPGQHACALW